MMMRRIPTLLALCLSACTATPPAPQVTLDEVRAVPATLEPETPRPMQVVTIPQLLPLPGMLKPRPPIQPTEEGAHTRPPETPKAQVNEATAAARVEPSSAGYINAMQIWPYSPAALYQVYTSPGQVTDLVFQAGEQLIDVSISDQVRWVVGDTKSGKGENEQTHLVIKPTRADLKANLIVATDRRTYYIELRSEPDTWMAAVSWDYPHDRLQALKLTSERREAVAPIATGIPLEQLKFRYEITGAKPPWRPVRAFDDGSKVYIQFPDGIAQGEMPPLFVIGSSGEIQLVNYRVRTPYYIVDRLFSAAELRLGGKKAQVVRIVRSDLDKRRR